MSSQLQLDVYAASYQLWWRHLVNDTKERQPRCYLEVKLCDPCLSAL